MDEEIVDILEYNLLCEIKRKEITKEDRSKILNDYMNRNNTSLREVAKIFNVPHTTLFYWANQEKRIEHLQKVGNLKGKRELEFLTETLTNFLMRIENKKVKLTDQDREEIVKIKDLSHKIFLMTRTLKI